jgi:hypothetical protein
VEAPEMKTQELQRRVAARRSLLARFASKLRFMQRIEPA